MDNSRRSLNADKPHAHKPAADDADNAGRGRDFSEMREARDGSDQWWHLHAKLYSELKLAPWEWPAIEHPDAECDYTAGSGGARWFPQAQQLYRELAARVAQ
jgi:hypothetical protein